MEDTEGFEEFRDELKVFVDETRKQSEERHQAIILNKKLKWYQLDLNESFNLGSYTCITRVPGGWIFESSQSNDAETATSSALTFIPLSNEYKYLFLQKSNESKSNNDSSCVAEIALEIALIPMIGFSYSRSEFRHKCFKCADLFVKEFNVTSDTEDIDELVKSNLQWVYNNF